MKTKNKARGQVSLTYEEYLAAFYPAEQHNLEQDLDTPEQYGAWLADLTIDKISDLLGEVDDNQVNKK